MKTNASRLLLIVDLAGTFLFGMEGAMTAIRNDLDFFGVLVLAFTTALVGGVIRDLLISAVPAASLRDSRHAASAFAAGAGVFVFHHFVVKIPSPAIIGLDAAGLGLFAVAGTEKALEFGIHPFIAVLPGTITGVGGAPCARCSWLRCRRFCDPIFTRRLPSPERSVWWWRAKWGRLPR
jgi:uncharacterized membrane protein YeiH